MPHDFRSLPKENAPGQVPPALGDIVRERAAKQRRSHGEVVTELLCVALKINPARFGITSGGPRRPRSRRPQATLSP